MSRKLLLASIVLLASQLQSIAGNNPGQPVFRLPIGVKASDMIPGTIIFKLKPEFRPAINAKVTDQAVVTAALKQIGAYQIQKSFPLHASPAVERNASGRKLVDLSLIYEIKINSTESIEKMVNVLLRTGMFEYAEPKYLPKPTFTPNDPNMGNQYFLGKIQAYAAWDIQQGDTNVVIGITDTGTDLNHPDLEPNLKYNYNDPADGSDNDGDGYVDNWRGWDLGESDNNPGVGANNHGSHVSGCAAAVTNNGTGVASPGFHCKYLPVKIADASGALSQAYEGIVYAADHGCRIINCSWGGAGGGSFGQNIIDYATNNQNALVVVAAGNDNNADPFYPAWYENVLSVASTTNNDAKSSFSNYGVAVDVCAPGSNIYTAMSNDTYNYMSGTSMASPVCAGAAAIVASEFPAYTPHQIAEKLRVTCDNIYTVPSNGVYMDKLGKGRINMFRALTENSPSVRMSDIVLTDSNDDAFVIGDTIRITGDITNYLDPTTNLDITLTTSSPWVNIIDNNTVVGALGTLATVNNNSDPFQVKINPGTPQNTAVILKLNFADGNYSDFQLIEMIVNVDYINITIGQVSTTITSKGRLCFNGTSQAEGLGFMYNGENLVYEAGLMIGSSNSKVSDNIRGAAGTDEDFQSAQVVQRLIPSVASEFDLFGKFNDNPAATSAPLPALISHKAFAWSTPGDDKYVIVQYTIKNTGAAALSNLWAGIFADWDIQDYSLNKADENTALKMGYVYNTTLTGLWAGIKLLTAAPFNHYAIDNLAGQGGVNMTDGYDTGEKYTTLSTQRPQAGVNGSGNDVIDVVSTGSFSVPAGDSVTVAFALIAGDNLTDLNTSAANAQIKYDGITSLPQYPISGGLIFYPNPVKESLIIETGNHNIAKVSIFDATGRLVSETIVKGATSKTVTIATSTLEAGVYFVRVSGKDVDLASKFVKE